MLEQEDAAAPEPEVFTEADEAELDKHQADIIKAVDDVVEGQDVRKVLEALIGRFPIRYRDAIIQRFRKRIEELNQEYARRRAEEERRKKSGITINGVLFNMASAVLLMATGTYEKIAGLFRKRPDVEMRVKSIGMALLKSGVTPDMNMVERLQKIYARAIQQQREREAREREQGVEANRNR